MSGRAPARKCCQPPKERIDRARGNGSRDSSSASSRNANWKSPQTQKVTNTRVVTNTRRPNTPPYSGSSGNEDEERRKRKSNRDKEKDADSQEEDEDSSDSEDNSEEGEGDGLLVKQNKSNQTYNYNMATSGRPSGTITTMEIQQGSK